MPDWSDQKTAKGALSQSRDGGATWSEPVVIAPNDDQLNPQGIGEEADFAELEDGRLLSVTPTLLLIRMVKQRMAPGRATWALHFDPDLLRLSELELQNEPI